MTEGRRSLGAFWDHGRVWELYEVAPLDEGRSSPAGEGLCTYELSDGRAVVLRQGRFVLHEPSARA